MNSNKYKSSIKWYLKHKQRLNPGSKPHLIWNQVGKVSKLSVKLEVPVDASSVCLAVLETPTGASSSTN